MKIIIIAAVALLMAGCGGSSDVEIKASEWTCTKVASVESLVLTPTGKTAMLLPQSRIECAQWTRMSEQL